MSNIYLNEVNKMLEETKESWWGFQKKDAGMMMIIETPDDATYQSDHPPGGRMIIGPRWRHQIILQGGYLDVFGYVSPDQDFNPERPTTRTDGLSGRIDCYNWVKNNLGLVGTETACDWTIPYVDFSSPLAPTHGMEIPLWDLVYHDAISTPYSLDNLRGLLNGGIPQLWRSPEINETFLNSLKCMSALNKRLAFA